MGISDHAQQALGDVVYVELPEVGQQLKAASDIYAPVSGVVIAVNEQLADSPEQVNNEPYGSWFFRLQPDAPAELEALLTAEAYKASCDAEA